MNDFNRGALQVPCLRLDYGFGEQWASVELGDGTGYVRLSDYEKAKDDNAKLRELVRDLWRFTGAACKKYPRLFDPSAQGGQTVQLNAIEAFEQRMHELGIEVEL